MNTHQSPKQLAVALTKRSTCNVQVAAVLNDGHGIFGWGHNHPGYDGMGEHAEQHALKRSSHIRLIGSTITVAAFRKGKMIMALPCTDKCLPLLIKRHITTINYTTQEGWKVLEL